MSDENRVHIEPAGLGAEERQTSAEGSGAVLPWVTWQEPIRYGAWRIYRNDFTAHPDWLSVAWLYLHEDYDGPEDNRHGHASSIDGCIAAIQEWEEDHAA